MKSKVILKINDPSEIKPLMSAVERYVEYINPEVMIRHVHGVFNLKRIDASKGEIKYRCYIYMTKTKQIIAEVVGKGTEILNELEYLRKHVEKLEEDVEYREEELEDDKRRLAESKQRIQELENEAKKYWRKND